MDGQADCTDAPGVIYCALDRIFAHLNNATRIVYDCRSKGYVDRDKCTSLNLELIQAYGALYGALYKAKRYASMIEGAQDAVEAISRVLDGVDEEQQ